MRTAAMEAYFFNDLKSHPGIGPTSRINTNTRIQQDKNYSKTKIRIVGTDPVSADEVLDERQSAENKDGS